MRLSCQLLLIAMSLAPSAAYAAPGAALPSEVRLSDAEKEKVLEAAASARKHEQAPIIADDPLPPQIHGEVGFSIGTGGYRSAYGTAIVPISEDGVAIISLGSTDFGSRGRYLYPQR